MERGGMEEGREGGDEREGGGGEGREGGRRGEGGEGGGKGGRQEEARLIGDGLGYD